MLQVLNAGWILTFDGEKILTDNSIVISDDKIIDILPTKDASAKYKQAQVKDYTNKYVMPGMINSHVHLCFDEGENPLSTILQERNYPDKMLIRSVKNGISSLKAGVTTVRDCGAGGDYIYKLRDAINSGMITGSRIVACGMPITVTGGHCWFLNQETDGIDEIKQNARKAMKNGADFLKVMISGGMMTPGSGAQVLQYGVDEMKALCEEAHMRGKKVAAHALSTQSIKVCIEAGIDTIEHCAFRGLGSSVDYDVALVEKMIEREIIFSPAFGATCYQEQKRTDAAKRRLKITKDMLKRGLVMAAGTDAGCKDTRHEDYHLMLKLLYDEFDMSCVEILQSATINAAKCIGMEDILGSIEIGKVADILVLDGNPLDNIDNVEKIDHIYLNGKLVYANGNVID